MLAAAAVVGATVLSLVLMADDHPARPRLRGRSGDRCPDRDAAAAQPPPADAVPQHHRGLCAHPRRRLLDLRVHAQAARSRLLARPEPAGRRVPVQPRHRAGRDHRQPRRVAARRGPGARRGKLHSRVPATILIAIGAFVATLGDTLTRFGMTDWFSLAKFLGVLFLFAGFLVSIEVFREIRIPFTSIRLGRTRHEPAGAEQLAADAESAGGPDPGRRLGGPDLAPRRVAPAGRLRSGPARGTPSAGGVPPALPWLRCPLRIARPSRASPSSSPPPRCSACSGRCRGSPTTPGWSRCRSWPGAAGSGCWRPAPSSPGGSRAARSA